MANGLTIGEQLQALRTRAGVSLDTIAGAAGYKGRSSVQRYFDAAYNASYLPRSIAERLAKGFIGTAVSPGDIMALAGLPETNAIVGEAVNPSTEIMRRDVPIYGTALGAPKDLNGKAIEQTTLNSGDVVAYASRPAALTGDKLVYGFYIQGSSMAPRYEEGEIVFARAGGRPPSIGDDVVVYLRDQDFDDGATAAAVLIKRLVRRTAEYTELEQFNPPMVFRVEADRILRIDRVLPYSEMLS